MGVSIYPVLNKDVPGFDATEVSGKALAAAIFETDSAFVILGNFQSMDENELRELIVGEMGQDPSEITVPAEEWFSPEDGLTAMRTLLAQPVEWETDEFAEWLTKDMETLEKVLLLAQDHGAMFHLAMDF